MQRQNEISEIEKIDAKLSSNFQYLCHYPLRSQFNKLLKKIGIKEKSNEELPDDCRLLVINVREKLLKLENANRQMIEKLDFIAECQRLINAGNKEELDGLVNIGEYFGVKKPYRSDVASALDEVLRHYQISSRNRTPQAKPCLDYLCELLNVPKLNFIKAQPSLFANKREVVDAIVANDDSFKLMVWLVDATKEEKEYALRLAAHKEGSRNCLLLLLSYTKPADDSISLLGQGNPSGQCALHRAVKSRSVFTVSCFFDTKCNPSHDILKQLLVKDNKGNTPVDYLNTEVKQLERTQMLTIISKAVQRYKSDPERALSEKDTDLLTHKLDALQVYDKSNNRCLN